MSKQPAHPSVSVNDAPARDHRYPMWSQTLAGRSLKAEVSLMLGVSKQQAERLLDSAATRCADYSALLALVTTGAVSVRNARVVTGAGVVLHTGDLDRDRVVRAASVKTPSHVEWVRRVERQTRRTRRGTARGKPRRIHIC